MQVIFTCQGHPNIRATHRKTLEFTRDATIGERATCIVGVRANFDPAQIKRLRGSIRITMQAGEYEDSVRAVVNPAFNHEHEIVFRKSEAATSRTLGIALDRGARDLNRKLIKFMQKIGEPMRITITEEAADDVTIGPPEPIVLPVHGTVVRIVNKSIIVQTSEGYVSTTCNVPILGAEVEVTGKEPIKYRPKIGTFYGRRGPMIKPDRLIVAADEDFARDKCLALAEWHYTPAKFKIDPEGRSGISLIVGPQAEERFAEITGEFNEDAVLSLRSPDKKPQQLCKFGKGYLNVLEDFHRQLWPDEMGPEEMITLFPDLEPYAKWCRYSDCSHIHEPECEVRAAVRKGLVLASRYDSYRRFYKQLVELLYG
jgi:hypothetical protein